MAVGTANDTTVVASDAANETQVPLDASRAAYLLVHGQEALFAALAKGDAFSSSTASTEASLSENASSHGGGLSPREGADALAAPSTQVSPSSGSYGAFAGGNVAAHLPTKKSRRGNRRRRTYQEGASSYADSGDTASIDMRDRDEQGNERRGVVTVHDLFNLGNCHTPPTTIATTEVSQFDCAWANAPSPISPCCAARTGPSNSGIVSTNPLTPSFPPPAAPEASTRIAYKTPSTWRSVTQAAPPALDSCALASGAAEAIPISPCKGLATPMGIVSTTPCNKILDASSRTPPGRNGQSGPFLGSPMASATVRPVQQAAMSIGAVTLAASPQHGQSVVGQTVSPNSNLSTPVSMPMPPVSTPVAAPGCTPEDTMRSWLAHNGLPFGGADLASQLLAAAPEVYED